MSLLRKSSFKRLRRNGSKPQLQNQRIRLLITTSYLESNQMVKACSLTVPSVDRHDLGGRGPQNSIYNYEKRVGEETEARADITVIAQ